jgi:hypothetical protein
MDAAFHRVEDVDRFVAEHGKYKLLELAMENKMHPASRRVVEGWFWLQQVKEGDTRDDPLRRSTAAAESSAAASLVSAQAARQSSKWTVWAVVVALLAALLAQ